MNEKKMAKLMDFNSHAHVERDDGDKNCGGVYLYFNSHAHVERDEFFYSISRVLKDFNSHAHVERDPTILFKFLYFFQFQLTRSRGA